MALLKEAAVAFSLALALALILPRIVKNNDNDASNNNTMTAGRVSQVKP